MPPFWRKHTLQGDNYFEIDVDVGSSSVARNVCGLAIGYSKAIVVDMGFCLQVRTSACHDRCGVCNRCACCEYAFIIDVAPWDDVYLG